MTDAESALAGLHADLEAVADLTPDQLHYLEHADEIREDGDRLECDASERGPLLAPGEEN